MLRIANRCAFTLIEVLIALFILSVAFLAILRGSVFNLRSTRESSNLTTAVIAAESIMKEEIAKGYPPPGKDEGVFEDEPFKGYRWEKSVEVLELPYVEELKLVTVTISWGKNGSYSLQTVLSRY
ncbi:MAG: prepilin-type N-terminal cleavage/methylation domain-containing protein [Candidatus Bathyarchaeia archaeon]